MSGNCRRAHSSPSNWPSLAWSDISVLQEAKPCCRRLQIKIPNKTIFLCRTSQKPSLKLSLVSEWNRMLMRTSSLKPRWTPVHRETNSQWAFIVKCARDEHDLKPGSYHHRILPSLPTTARWSKTTVPVCYTRKALCSVALCHDRRTL